MNRPKGSPCSFDSHIGGRYFTFSGGSPCGEETLPTNHTRVIRIRWNRFITALASINVNCSGAELLFDQMAGLLKMSLELTRAEGYLTDKSPSPHLAPSASHVLHGAAASPATRHGVDNNNQRSRAALSCEDQVERREGHF